MQEEEYAGIRQRILNRKLELYQNGPKSFTVFKKLYNSINQVNF